MLRERNLSIEGQKNILKYGTERTVRMKKVLPISQPIFVSDENVQVSTYGILIFSPLRKVIYIAITYSQFELTSVYV